MSNHEETADATGDRPGDTSGSEQAKTWVVTSSDRACKHRYEDLEHVGSDGINGYYRCVRCDAVLVSQDELVRMARASRTDSD